jgi:hypothetical protein
MIDNHPDFCGPAPSHLIRTFALNRLRYGDITAKNNWQALVSDIADLLNNQLGTWHTHWTSAKIENGAKTSTLAAIVRYIYETEAQALGKSKVFIKENQTYRFIPFLLSSFPEAKFIYLVRDPRDMALSWKLSANHPGGVLRGAQVWKEDQRKSLEVYGYLMDVGRIILVKYEELVSHPVEQLQRLCDFLEVSFIPAMLEFYNNDLTVNNARRLEDWHNLQKPVLSNNFNKYRTQLLELEIKYIEALCAPEMEYFDYRCEFPPDNNLSALETELSLQEKSWSVESKPLQQAEQALRERRLAVIRRIIERPISF